MRSGIIGVWQAVSLELLGWHWPEACLLIRHILTLDTFGCLPHPLTCLGTRAFTRTAAFPQSEEGQMLKVWFRAAHNSAPGRCLFFSHSLEEVVNLFEKERPPLSPHPVIHGSQLFLPVLIFRGSDCLPFGKKATLSSCWMGSLTPFFFFFYWSVVALEYVSASGVA